MTETTPEPGSYGDPEMPWNTLTEETIGDWNRNVIAEFRANDGVVGGAYEGGAMILLTTTGARSGRPHTVPLGPLYRGEQMYVSSFIEKAYPAWWHNVRKNPAVTIEIGARTVAAIARALEGDEYAEFAARALADNPDLAAFQATVDRPIPLVTLTPR
ncbi:nitroreductase/quinone reductase family protein [Tsukamurella paurometabola]|uniref:Nitroreductase Rv1558/MT1609 n=1 Tax=Tsukamurella paurometabola TaxID=2061 RepID=A0A3P8MBJ3_TSUPA|nr:nitroreductase/quinone reductase family protein [Tsukamurella paurometabola]MBS4102039.1 nitroreductase family deazaflavin-dependent oxidoreductase [Tsukamurella paurometabola]UEA82427.1 nitroreductase family deazaflavin-dependent oxidoreductase [Tsukamurella paurometabola]VDR39480.1 Putative nitroreductase Rv1558/MT1609 [Tsukamurella paurometabola]